MSDADRPFTLEELEKCDGKEGRPMYVAYKGVVYDVSKSKLWRTGIHMRKHAPGGDLTAEIADAPHGEEVFSRVPRVGAVAGYTAPAERVPQYEHLPAFLARLLQRVPFLERHPHPMTVHFPIAFLLATPVFAAIYLLTGSTIFEVTSVNTLAAGAFFNLVAVVTGLLTWWINYEGDPVRPVIVKIVTSLIMLADGVTALIWRIVDPAVLTGSAPTRWVYFGMLVFFVPAVSVVGWFGATLTFPLSEPHHRKKTGASKAP